MTKKETSYYGLGRRKSAVAQVILQKDEAIGHKINGIELDKYFTTVDMRTAATAPLVLTSLQEEWKMKVKVAGGGKRAQAGAVMLGVARALIKIDSDLRTQLKTAGMLTRDARVKERKKFGLKGARRAPQFSKR